jgi:hypothetical protein
MRPPVRTGPATIVRAQTVIERTALDPQPAKPRATAPLQERQTQPLSQAEAEAKSQL